MSDVDFTELRSIANQLEQMGLRRTATRVRLVIENALSNAVDDERVAPVQNFGAIPWSLYERLWKVYASDGHGSQSAERLAERGGFSRGEIGMLAVGVYSSDGRSVRGYEKRMPLLDIYEESKR